jgi:hypothetical protein
MKSNASPVSGLACILLLVAFGASGAPLKLREAVSTVTVSASSDGAGQAVSPDTALTPGQFVQTGPESRAEFVTAKGVLRLGSQTIIRVPEIRGEIQLERGTALFDSSPKEARLSVRLGDEPVVIEGGAGFAMLSREGEGKPAILHVGSLAGRTTVRLGGKSIALAPAQVLSMAAGGQTRVGAFNLAKQFESSTLVHGFKSPLPDRKGIEREAARFASLQRRGFVQPESLSEAGLGEETVRRSVVDGSGLGVAGQIGGIGLSGSASVSSHFSGLSDEFGFQSRIAIIGGGAGQVPDLPGWQNPRNPHFGSPQNDSLAAGTPGPGRGPRP